MAELPRYKSSKFEDLGWLVLVGFEAPSHGGERESRGSQGRIEEEEDWKRKGIG